MKNILILILIFLVSFQVSGQNYIQLDAFDVNHLPIEASQLAEINTAADSLVAIFPSEFQNQFKVYDIGTYVIQESTSEGFDQFLEIASDKINNISPYYLIFIRESNKDGILQNIIIKIKLPNTGRFICLSPSRRSSFDKIYTSMINNYYQSEGGSIEKYSKSQKFLLDTLKSNINSIIKCCEPTLRTQSCPMCLSESERKSLLEESGFIPIPIDSSFESGIITLNNPNERSSKITVNKYSNRIIFLGDEQINISDNVSSFINSIENLEDEASIWITSNRNLCDQNEFSTASVEFENSNAKIKTHFHIDEDSKLLYINDGSKYLFDYSSTIAKPDTSPTLEDFLKSHFMGFLNWNGIKYPRPKFDDNVKYPNILKRFWNTFNHESYVSRTYQYASYWAIPSNYIFFYELIDEKVKNIVTGEYLPKRFSIVLKDGYSLKNKKEGLWKSIFRNRKVGVYYEHTSKNDDEEMIWDCSFDENEEAIPTINDYNSCEFGTEANSTDLIMMYPGGSSVKKNMIPLAKKINGTKLIITTLKKIPIKSWYNLVKQVDQILLPNIDKLKKLYPNAKFGYRGSLAVGKKFDKNLKKYVNDIDLTDWDCDAFIVSDELFNKLNGWKDFRKLKDCPVDILNTIEDNLKRLSGFRYKDRFTFKVWSNEQFENIIKKYGYKLL